MNVTRLIDNEGGRDPAINLSRATLIAVLGIRSVGGSWKHVSRRTLHPRTGIIFAAVARLRYAVCILGAFIIARRDHFPQRLWDCSQGIFNRREKNRVPQLRQKLRGIPASRSIEIWTESTTGYGAR